MSKKAIYLHRGNQGDPDCLNISWNHDGNQTYFIDSEGAQVPKEYKLKKEGQQSCLVSNDLKFSIIFDEKLWWQKPKLPEGPWIYLAKSEDLWDGPMAIGWDSLVWASLPSGEGFIKASLPGSKEECSFPTHEAFDERLFGARYLQFALKLELGLRHQIKLDTFDLEQAAFLVFLRMAYPQEYFELYQLPVHHPLAPQWKRLCQNLDIRCGKAPRWQEMEPSLVTVDTSFVQENPQEILRLVNEKATIVPDKLITT